MISSFLDKAFMPVMTCLMAVLMLAFIVGFTMTILDDRRALNSCLEDGHKEWECVAMMNGYRPEAGER